MTAARYHHRIIRWTDTPSGKLGVASMMIGMVSAVRLIAEGITGGSQLFLVLGAVLAPALVATAIRMPRCGIDATIDGALIVRHLLREHHIGPGALVDVRLRTREFRHDHEIVLVTRTGEIRTGVIEGGDAALVRETAAGLRTFCATPTPR